MPSEQGYSADVKLCLWHEMKYYDLRATGPDHGRFVEGEPMPPVGAKCEVVVEVDGSVHRSHVRITGYEGSLVKWERLK